MGVGHAAREGKKEAGWLAFGCAREGPDTSGSYLVGLCDRATGWVRVGERDVCRYVFTRSMRAALARSE